jgi:hypothetical protein
LYILIIPSSSLVVNTVPVAFHYVVSPLSFRSRHLGGAALTSTIPILAPLANSATTSPFQLEPLPPPPTSSSGLGGVTFHILTVPSRAPVARWWYDLPQLGAQDREVSGEATEEEEDGGRRCKRVVGVGSRDIIWEY